MAKHRILAIDFSHMHMGDLLRLVCEHANAEVVGAIHHEPQAPREVLRRLNLRDSLIYDDLDACIAQTQPNAAVICAPTTMHCEWALRAAGSGLHALIEKPFASSLSEADLMLDVFESAGLKLAINWPLAWYPVHQATKKLVDQGAIGDLLNIHYYDGNRGPLLHQMDKIALNSVDIESEKKSSWFYQKEHGGGSMLDYLGYGVTLASWFNNGAVPLEVTSVVDKPPGLEVDEHSVTVARYPSGLYKFETRWGTFTDPWTHQPAPKCGFVVCGAKGTICSYDFEETIRIQTSNRPEGYDLPVSQVVKSPTDPITYFLDCIENDREIQGPLSPRLSRVGQVIVDSATLSAASGRTVRVGSDPAVAAPRLLNVNNHSMADGNHGAARRQESNN